MRTIVFSGVLAFIFFCNSTSAQDVNGPIESIQTHLCKNWEVDYVLMGGMKIGRMPDATEINYQFNKDKTFFMTSDDPIDKTKGTWSYDPKKKLIRLTLNGKSSSSVVSLKNDELVMIAEPNGATPEDLPEMRMIFKPKISSSVKLTSAKPKDESLKPSAITIKNTILKNPDSAILYVGIQNIIEIEGVQNNNEHKILASVSRSDASIRKVSENRYIVLPTKTGVLTIMFYRTPKVLATKQFNIVSKK